MLLGTVIFFFFVKFNHIELEAISSIYLARDDQGMILHLLKKQVHLPGLNEPTHSRTPKSRKIVCNVKIFEFVCEHNWRKPTLNPKFIISSFES